MKGFENADGETRPRKEGCEVFVQPVMRPSCSKALPESVIGQRLKMQEHLVGVLRTEEMPTDPWRFRRWFRPFHNRMARSSAMKVWH
ncbi:MAG: hypothetical protein AAF066_17660 [Pseudomonadota bacterium]